MFVWFLFLRYHDKSVVVNQQTWLYWLCYWLGSLLLIQCTGKNRSHSHHFGLKTFNQSLKGNLVPLRVSSRISKLPLWNKVLGVYGKVNFYDTHQERLFGKVDFLWWHFKINERETSFFLHRNYKWKLLNLHQVSVVK